MDGEQQLSDEELISLTSKLSSDDQRMLTDLVGDCTREMTLYRGLPFTAAVLGSMYYARQRLPSSLYFGPKGLPFYFIIGIGALTTANVFSMSTCKRRLMPTLIALNQKYSNGTPSDRSYEELRRLNRANLQPRGSVMPPSLTETQTDFRTAPAEYTSAKEKSEATRAALPLPSYLDDGPYMSGTPVDVPKKTTSYGDEGFS